MKEKERFFSYVNIRMMALISVVITRKCVLINLLLRFPSVASVTKPSLLDIAGASQRG